MEGFAISSLQAGVERLRQMTSRLLLTTGIALGCYLASSWTGLMAAPQPDRPQGGTASGVLQTADGTGGTSVET